MKRLDGCGENDDKEKLKTFKKSLTKSRPTGILAKVGRSVKKWVKVD
jgi:hypothetical protein